MDRPPEEPVTEAIKIHLDQWSSERRGFIIVFPARQAGPTGFGRVFSGHDKPESWQGGARVFAAQVEQPHKWVLFDTYQEAYETAQWAAPKWGGIDTIDRTLIAEVVVRPPVDLLSSRPVSVLDALSEI